MKKLLICQHVPFEPLGTLHALFKSAGFRMRYINFGRHPDLKPSIEGYHGLVILGGPMNVDQTHIHLHLIHEMTLIEEALKKDIPVLGICLGAQLIAKVLGAHVGKNREKEIGWYDVAKTEAAEDDPLLGHFRPVERIMQWHGDAFALPQGAVHLASSELCSYQAFRYGKKVYGFQFHLEVDEPMIEQWLKVPTHLKELEGLTGKIDPAVIKKETPLYIDRLKKLSNQTFGEFIKLLGVEKKFKLLPSR